MLIYYDINAFIDVDLLNHASVYMGLLYFKVFLLLCYYTFKYWVILITNITYLYG